MAWMKHLVRISAASAILFAAAGAAGAGQSLAPISPDDAVSTHGPFEMGECGICHDPQDKAAPGRLLKSGSALCFDCHEDFKAPVKNHPKVDAKSKCTGCHSPHNSKKRKLLL